METLAPSDLALNCHELASGLTAGYWRPLNILGPVFDTLEQFWCVLMG